MPFLWPDLQSAASPADALLRRMRGTVAVAHGLAVAGRPMDLHGLDTLAGQLCAQMLDLAPAESAVLCPALVDLERDVAALIELMRSKHQ